MSSTFRHLKAAFAAVFAAALALSASAVCAQQPSSVFDVVYGSLRLYSPADVLRAYEGSWNGIQTVKFGGITSRGTVAVSYKFDIAAFGLPRLVGIGRITSASGASVPTRSYMSVDTRGRLLLEVRAGDGEAVFYKGSFNANYVEWTPIYDFLLYDYQKDTFLSEGGKRFIYSDGARTIFYKGTWGRIEANTRFSEIENAYPASKVNTLRSRDVKVKSGGAKFGR